jgi:hypothetical protein
MSVSVVSSRRINKGTPIIVSNVRIIALLTHYQSCLAFEHRPKHEHYTSHQLGAWHGHFEKKSVGSQGGVGSIGQKVLTRIISLWDIFDASAVASVLRWRRGHGLGGVGFEQCMRNRHPSQSIFTCF